MILVVLAIAAATAVGVGAERRLGNRAEAVSARLVATLLWFVYPPVVFFVVSDLRLTSGVGIGIGLAFLTLAVVGSLAYAFGRRVLALPAPQLGAVVATTILVNTGYLGVPLCAALLGREALAPAIAYDSVVSATMLYGPAFAIGAAFGTRAGSGVRQRARAFVLRNPVLFALVAGLLAPDMPDVLVSAAEVVAIALLPVGFFLLGLNLHLPVGFHRPVGLVLALRAGLAPALLAGMATAADAGVPDAYLVQAAMPSGINSLIVAHTFGLDARLTAECVAWTHAVVVAGALVASGFV